MANDYKRFIVPLIFSAIGMILTFWMTQILVARVINIRPVIDLVPAIDGTLNFDISFLLMLLIPIFFIEFLVLTLPFAFIMLLFAKVFRVATYKFDIMRIGQGFNWVRIMKRAVVPALFALSLGELVISLLNGVIFWIPPMEASDARAIDPYLNPLVTMFGALIALTISIALFSPTWLLNDSGIVAHVKPKHLEYRRCPDTEGVGRWFSNLLGGFGILAFPIAMFHRYFYLKFLVNGEIMNFVNVMASLGWTVGLPFLVMAFILPVIILNELTIKWTGSTMQRIAKAMGASEVQFQRVEKTLSVDLQDRSESNGPSESTEPTNI
ncbi:MAG: hypothetical protein AM325_007105 [Candidatus Thorarchaeota archaeon SMTZ1-45]|nr:MAG: hypothetical protein AM325_08835 [Candidatus Thorarchaeota archaeon SMTZ1-45]